MGLRGSKSRTGDVHAAPTSVTVSDSGSRGVTSRPLTRMLETLRNPPPCTRISGGGHHLRAAGYEALNGGQPQALAAPADENTLACKFSRVDIKAHSEISSVLMAS